MPRPRSLGKNRQIVSMLLIRQNFKCFYCGRVISCRSDIDMNKATLDHRVPLAFGGDPYGDNIVAACKPCNQEKGPLDEETFLTIRGDKVLRRHAIRNAERKLQSRKLVLTRKGMEQRSRESMIEFQIAIRPVLDAYRKNNAGVAE